MYSSCQSEKKNLKLGIFFDLCNKKYSGGSSSSTSNLKPAIFLKLIQVENYWHDLSSHAA